MNELRNFAGTDFFAYQGAMDFPDGTKPMIAEGEKVILITSGFDTGKDFGISLIFDEDDESIDFLQAFKVYYSVERAISDAKLFAQLLDCNMTREFLSDFGFEVI